MKKVKMSEEAEFIGKHVVLWRNKRAQPALVTGFETDKTNSRRMSYRIPGIADELTSLIANTSLEMHVFDNLEDAAENAKETNEKEGVNEAGASEAHQVS